MPRHTVDSETTQLIAAASESACKRFQAAFPGEHVYAFALVGSTTGSHLRCALATEEGLSAVAEKYADRGYRVRGGDLQDTLRRWLRWANPDDGWRHDVESFKVVNERLEKGLADGSRREFDGRTEEHCVAALKYLDARHAFDSLGERSEIVIGFTYGEDPDDLIRFSSKLNPKPLVKRWKAEAAEGFKLFDLAGVAGAILRPGLPEAKRRELEAKLAEIAKHRAAQKPS